MSQRVDRVHLCGHDCRIQAKTDPDQSADGEAPDDRPCGDARGISMLAEFLDHPGKECREAGAHSDADQTSHEADDSGLD
jgi:hypothetical protein